MMGRFADMAEEIRSAATALDELARQRNAAAPPPAAPLPAPAPTSQGGSGPAPDTTTILNRLDAIDRRLEQQGSRGGSNVTGTDFRALVGLGD